MYRHICFPDSGKKGLKYMRTILALGVAMLMLAGCPNYGEVSWEHWPPTQSEPTPTATVADMSTPQAPGPDMTTAPTPPDMAVASSPDMSTAPADMATTPPDMTTGGQCDLGHAPPPDMAKRDCDGDCDDCKLKCHKDHDDRDKDNDDHHQQCIDGTPKLHDPNKGRDFCDREDHDRRKHCQDQDNDCVLKCKKDKDDCHKGGN
jgi:hypothetical protein